MNVPVGQPWDTVGVDIMGPMEATKNGNRYILVFMDYMTKWPEVIALKNIGSKDVATAFINEVVCRHGVPKKLISDRGGNFMSDLMAQVLHLTGTVKLNTTSYHPQTDGLVERFNKTLMDMLSMYTNKNKTDWDEHIPYVVFAYRSSIQESAQKDPFFLTYGRTANFPLTAEVETVGAVPSNEKYAEKVLGRLAEAREEAR